MTASSFLKNEKKNCLNINVITNISFHNIKQVPNAVGFALGTAQLIVYFIYRGKTPPKETPTDEEQGSGHLIGKMEMVPMGQLQKGSSLPKQSLARQDSAVKIVKAFSMPPLESHSLSLRKERN
jgi:threonine/homoserine efflux transporter RhtA